MVKKQYLLFDLDGTLTNPMEGITKSVEYALGHFGIKVENRQQLCCFIGPPLRESFSSCYGLNQHESDVALEKFREYFSEKGMYENEVYPGVRKMLEELKDSGSVITLATSKPEFFAKKILKHFSLDGYFDYIGGADLQEIRVKKGEVIKHVFEQIPPAVGTDIIMIGDRTYDIMGAKEHGVKSVGVLYGFGSREELVSAGADDLAESVEDLQKILEGTLNHASDI